MSIFTGPEGPTDVEIMTEVINEQTEVIKEAIDEQTEIMIKGFDKLAKQNVRNTETILNSIRTVNFHQLVDDVQGSIQTLVVKLLHMQSYKHTCILDWGDIAIEASLEDVFAKMGRVGSFARRFCSLMGNLQFCGNLIYQYVLLAILRQRVHAETIDIVRRSAFHNNHIKVKGLHAEFLAAQDADWNLLQDILLSRGETTHCQVQPMGCVFHARLQHYWLTEALATDVYAGFSIDARNDFDCLIWKANDNKCFDNKCCNKYATHSTGLNKQQTAIVVQYLEQVNNRYFVLYFLYLLPLPQ